MAEVGVQKVEEEEQHRRWLRWRGGGSEGEGREERGREGKGRKKGLN